MIITDTSTIQNYISINGTVDFKNVKSYINAAERKFLKPLIGKEQIAAFIAEEVKITPDSVVLEALELAREAVANFGYYLYLPIGAVQVSDSGIHVTNGDKVSSASDKQFKELQRSFKKSGHEALDELLEFMEESPDKFPTWVGSSSFSIYKELLVNKTSTFNKDFHIFNSRQTFMALKPNIKIVEDQFIENAIGVELLAALKGDPTVEERKQVKRYLQQSIVAFTIMKTVDNGMFVLDANGIHMRFDELPYEKTLSSGKELTDSLKRLKANKQIEGEEYLKKAINVIEENLEKFEEYSISVTESKSGLINTKGIVSF